MSHETMIENIRAKFDNVDTTSLQPIWTIVNRSKPKPAALLKRPGSLKFQNAAIPERP